MIDETSNLENVNIEMGPNTSSILGETSFINSLFEGSYGIE